MTDTADHRVNMFRLANERRAAGKNPWEYRVTVHLEGLDEFTDRRDAFVRAIRTSRWYRECGQDGDLEMFVDDLADTEDGDEFDVTMAEVYTCADWDRAWIEVKH